jgi:Holliday junction resolvasome RuvABC DNA-binding subunit
MHHCNAILLNTLLNMGYGQEKIQLILGKIDDAVSLDQQVVQALGMLSPFF